MAPADTVQPANRKQPIASAARHARHRELLKSAAAALEFGNGADMFPMPQHWYVPTSWCQRHRQPTMGMPGLREKLHLQTTQLPHKHPSVLLDSLIRRQGSNSSTPRIAACGRAAARRVKFS
jgi:hypothetical protein